MEKSMTSARETVASMAAAVWPPTRERRRSAGDLGPTINRSRPSSKFLRAGFFPGFLRRTRLFVLLVGGAAMASDKIPLIARTEVAWEGDAKVPKVRRCRWFS